MGTWQSKEMSSFILVAGNDAVAYGELHINPLEMSEEVERLLVAPSRRGQGLGSRLLEEMYQVACRRRGVARVTACLDGDSAGALGCFLKAGFALESSGLEVKGLKLARVVQR